MNLADEGLNGKIVRALRTEGFKVEWIKETYRGMSDERIIELAKDNNQIFITEDKDFGEWVFAHHLSGSTIIFLRYDKPDFDIVLSYLKKVLKSGIAKDASEFITINKNKVRRRFL